VDLGLILEWRKYLFKKSMRVKEKRGVVFWPFALYMNRKGDKGGYG